MQVVATTVELPFEATAPPAKAEFEVIAQAVVVTIESPNATIAPPWCAEFEVMKQSVAVTTEPPSAATTPPVEAAEFEVIVQCVAATTEWPKTRTAPPRESVAAELAPPAPTIPVLHETAKLEDRMHSDMVTVDSFVAYTAPPPSATARFEVNVLRVITRVDWAAKTAPPPNVAVFPLSVQSLMTTLDLVA